MTAVFAPSDIGNYKFTTNTLKAAVLPATLQVVADAKRTPAGQPDLALTWQATGWKGGDSNSLITGSLSRATGNQPGTYTILPGTLSAGSNYTISFTTANFIVDPSFVLTLQKSQQVFDPVAEHANQNQHDHAHGGNSCRFADQYQRVLPAHYPRGFSIISICAAVSCWRFRGARFPRPRRHAVVLSTP